VIESRQYRDVINFFWERQQRGIQRQHNPIADLALDKCEEMFQRGDWRQFAYWHAIYNRERHNSVGYPLAQTHVSANASEDQMSDASFTRRMFVFATCAFMVFFVLVAALLDMRSPSGPLNFHLHWGIGSEVVIHSRLVLIGSAELAAVIVYLSVRTMSRRPAKAVVSHRRFLGILSTLHFPFIVRADDKPNRVPVRDRTQNDFLTRKPERKED
jgi:hypothetical protein